MPVETLGGELLYECCEWQLHLSAAWTSHNTPAFDFAGRTLELTAAGFSTGIEGGAAQGLGQGANPPVSRYES